MKQAREQRGIGQKEVAHAVGFAHASSVGNLENGDTTTGGPHGPAIAKFLGVPLDWIQNGPDIEDIRNIIRPEVANLESHQVATHWLAHEDTPNNNDRFRLLGQANQLLNSLSTPQLSLTLRLISAIADPKKS
ncbi:MAG: helix-turn-helix domain-containing protein [Burkholderiaceae bacterium]